MLNRGWYQYCAGGVRCRPGSSHHPELFEIRLGQLGQNLRVDRVFAKDSVHIAPSRDRAATSKCPRRHGGLLFLNAQLNPIVKTPKGGTDAGHNLSQSALQHLAQDLGAAARKRRRAADHRIFEDALYGGAAEAASRPNEDAGKQAVAEEGGGGRRDRPVKAVGRSADRGDGQEPDHRRAADRRLGPKAALGRPPEAVLAVL